MGVVFSNISSICLIISFFKSLSSIYLTISIALIILAILSQVVVLFVKKKNISFAEFNKRVSIGGEYFSNNYTFSFVKILAIVFYFSFAISFYVNGYKLLFILLLDFIVLGLYCSFISRLIKAIFYLFNDNETINYLCCRAVYYDSNNIKELIDTYLKSSKANSLIDDIDYLMNKKNAINLIAEQFFLIDDLYKSMPSENKSNKLKEYIESLASLIENIVDIELKNEMEIKDKKVEYFDNQYNKKLDLLIRHNKSLQEGLNNNFN